MLEVCGENCALSGKGPEETSSILGCSDGPGILVGEGAGSQQGDGLTRDPGEGRVNLVCSCDAGGLEGTMQLDHLLETYHDQLRLENASEPDCCDY